MEPVGTFVILWSVTWQSQRLSDALLSVEHNGNKSDNEDTEEVEEIDGLTVAFSLLNAIQD